ncbi:hypothetical protein MCOR25_006837 [Pyricularia grisea]|uniref:Myb-like domain-containing protein n=1 Tax=Pyricularia grisea TaxID=148305 RepID=A0A6P8AS33_PYRGI|nr:uncharacterized protein PgNI_09725 [Pyricularia grisea]KAI6360130.1 hypothetical protein MCOR25_006837 [Pyricularia grisea]TLD04907.1 hypothetical protein PgNI_09725 [Pyricularia grisea]
MNHKNWSDRADRDLFFTILSVKQIGVISGAEWQTIGSHMRTLGYGFTNEGCRQHFQGLRRAQNKAEANDTVESSPRRTDPTLNPITRRPGPGRGRPRRLPGKGEIPTDGEAPVTPTTPVPAQDQQDMKYHVQPPAEPQFQVQIGDTHLQNTSLRHTHQQHNLHQHEQSQHYNQQQEQQQQQQQQHHQSQSQPQPMAMMVPLHADGIDFGPHDPHDDDDDHAGHDIKRQRQESPTDASLEDEAVLHALAAANGTGAVDSYSDDFGYGEA